MKLAQEMIDRVKEMDTDPYREYEYIGIRVQEHPFEIGGLDHLSHVWVDGDDTGEELDGVCAVLGRAIHLSHQYFGDHVAIIGGNRGTYGEDPGEIIISDPVVLEVLA